MNTVTTLNKDTLLSIPEKKSARIEVVDALRGFALFGILLVHASEWFAAGGLPASVYQQHGGGTANGIAQAIVGIFFFGKFFTFFSFLFGLSFALMMTRTTESQGAFYRRFAWRLVILGAIGMLHHLHWQGDILSIYAILGFLMLPFGRVPEKWVLVIAVLLVLNVPAQVRQIYTELIAPPKKEQQPQRNFEKEAEAFYKTLKTGTYPETLRRNWKGFKDKMEFQVESGRLYITLGFFLLGLYAGRRRLFQQLETKRAFFGKVAKFTGFGTLAMTAAGAGLYFAFESDKQPPKAAELLFMTLFNAQSAAITVFYIAGLTLLFQRQFWQWAVPGLASIGKMALTNYIVQTLIGTLLFMGYGFGLLGEIDIWQATLLTFPIFFTQIFLSRLWLSRFRFGPLEWLWRSLTLGKVQPMLYSGR